MADIHQPDAAHIVVEHVSLSFPSQGRSSPNETLTVLDDVSLRISKGEFVVLLGPSGCGKSTILNLIAGFEQPSHGRVLCDGVPVRGPGPARGMVFQQANLFPWLTVMENVTFGPRMQGADKARIQHEAANYLALMGLEGFRQHYPWQLSGGMKQRVALARAWLPNPNVLLMDEPFGALDAQTRLMMQELLLAAWQKTGTTLLFVTHDVDEALFLADRVLVMSARPGRIADAIELPFGRERNIETLAQHPDYAVLKKRILHRVREEARRHLNL